MPYRGEWKCHVCGEQTRLACPICGEGVCTTHTLAGQIKIAPETRERLGDRLAIRLGDDETCTVCIERELARSMGPFVRIYTGRDPIQIEILTDALRSEGFDACALGTRDAALIGAAQHIFEQRIEVPEGQAEKATEILHALISGENVVLESEEEDDEYDDDDRDDEYDDDPDDEYDDDDDPDDEHDDDDPDDEYDDDDRDDRYDDDDRDNEYNDERLVHEGDDRHVGDDEKKAPDRSHALAAGLVFVFPGLGHVYARSPWSALPIAFSGILGLLMLGESSVFSGVVIAGVYIADIIGGQLAVRRWNRGERPNSTTQFVYGLVAAFIVVVAAMLVAELS